MKLLEVLQGLDYEVLKGNTDTEIREIQNDSRKVQPGDLFFCISGAVSDGHTYAEDVAAKGAAVIVVEKPVNVPDTVTVIRVKSTRYAMGKISSAFYGNPSEKLTVIGLTGTKGKTTTTYMIREMLERSGIKTGLIGTIEIIDGNQKIHANNTTPESMILHKYLKNMVENGCKAVVMVVSSQGLMLDRVAVWILIMVSSQICRRIISVQMNTQVLRNTETGKQSCFHSARLVFSMWTMQMQRT